MLLAAFGGHDPRTAEKRRLMPHMLAMAAGQIGHPVPFFIEMVTDDDLVHDGVTTPSVFLSSIAMPLSFLKR